MRPFSLNIRGRIVEYTRPAVMGILNVTPDSFYESSRACDAEEIERKVAQMISEGVDIIDVGAYSTRPGGYHDVSEDEELVRLRLALSALRKVSPDIPVSVDTFRASVAEAVVKEMGADIINDISGGNADPDMFATVSRLHVPYVLMHSPGDCGDIHAQHECGDITAKVLRVLADKIVKLQLMGVNDIIVDPGFGFGKTIEQNYELLKNLSVFQTLHLPLLVGVSRKSMITKLLGITADDAGNGTTVINTIALMRGASILRVHDVLPARQAIEIYLHSF